MGYVELEVGARCAEGIFLPNVANKSSQYLYPGIVACEPDKRGENSKFVIPYANISTEYMEINTDDVIGHLSPSQTTLYNVHDVTSSQIPVCGVTVEASDEDKIPSLLIIINSQFSQDSKENIALRKLIYKYPEVFAVKGEPLTITPYYCHTIRQKTDQPIYSKPYPIPLKFHQQIEEQLQDLYAQGLIQPSCSAYNSPLVPVTKKDGGIRLCLDFRKLNNEIIDDKHPLPNMQTIMQQLGESQIFTSLDLRMGYHQVPLAEEAREKTAFCTPYGMWEYYTCVPFGLKTAPAALQKMINNILHGLVGKIAQVYLDDIIILGADFHSHVDNLEQVLRRLADARMSLRLDKCHFFKEEVSYLGHIVGKHGIRPQPEKVAGIQDIPVPKTIRDVQSFLGLCNYYRKFVHDCARIATPLNQLLLGHKNEKN